MEAKLIIWNVKKETKETMTFSSGANAAEFFYKHLNKDFVLASIKVNNELIWNSYIGFIE